MMIGNEFILYMEANRKLDKGEPLTPEEQAVIDKFGRREKKLCGCGCGKELEPRVDGERHTIGGVEVNTDCYFDKMGDELDAHPIGVGFRGRPRGGVATD